jgi:hypothetical protein
MSEVGDVSWLIAGSVNLRYFRNLCDFSGSRIEWIKNRVRQNGYDSTQHPEMSRCGDRKHGLTMVHSVFLTEFTVDGGRLCG